MQLNTITKRKSLMSKPNIIKKKSKFKNILKCWQLYVFLIPTLIYFILFCYGPMYGVQLAFKEYNASLGIAGSQWVGFDNFMRFFDSYQFKQLLVNTLTISIYQLIVSFPIPIILALALNQVKNSKFKKIVQTVTYAPHFISIVVLVGMLNIFFSTRGGLINEIVQLFGGEPILFLGEEQYFRHMYVWSGVWQSMGWNAIIYLAALSGVSPELHEAAIVDGANKIKRIWHIDIPAILPTIVILLILNCGQLMSVGFEKAFLMQNSLNIGVSEIIPTYVYKMGLLNAQYSFSTAVGLFNSVINCTLLVIVNKISKKIGQTGIW
ncbi:ABC transporter permease [Clostridium tarantellae]|uniref:ABC transporter permease subunit n=1 Tax=Clostridium tarantellae TaxID=39493 RepID=A0A6I1MPM4_9CLOT|nr:ABC transporter permease subunit [Clostridium tarantellae]MPQ44418.1 ABC transporter permease subunit [Clostridium tarantellae]